jgi:hypothetical protein
MLNIFRCRDMLDCEVLSRPRFRRHQVVWVILAFQFPSFQAVLNIHAAIAGTLRSIISARLHDQHVLLDHAQEVVKEVAAPVVLVELSDELQERSVAGRWP